jgi:hypothetical protein
MAIFGATVSPIGPASPRLGLVPIPNVTVTAFTLTTGGGVGTLTPQQLLGGFIDINCDDAQSCAFPSAESLIAAIPGVSGSAQVTGAVGFDVDIRNNGDSTLTMTAGTGCTLTGTATLLTVTCKRFKIVITNGVQGSATYTVYSMGPTTY